MALYNSQKPSFAVTIAGSELGVLCLCLSRAAQASWFLGYPAQALQRIDKALNLARASFHLYSPVWTLMYAAYIHHWRREYSLTQVRTQEAMALAREQGFASALREGGALEGWVQAMQGQRAEGITQIRQSLATGRVVGIDLILLLEAYKHEGRSKEGLKAVAEGFAAMNKTGLRLFEAEMYRLKGELSLKSGVRSPESEAEECFHKAIEVARRQEAKSLELRATMSLSHLWQQQRKHKQAHQMLEKVYGWFTEGFDTLDLQEAKALLGELNPSTRPLRAGLH